MSEKARGISVQENKSTRVQEDERLNNERTSLIHSYYTATEPTINQAINRAIERASDRMYELMDMRSSERDYEHGAASQ